MNFPRCAPARIRCPLCGFYPLEIWALVFYKTWANTGKLKECAEPVLVCTSANGRMGCGTLFSIEEFGLKMKDLVKK